MRTFIAIEIPVEQKLKRVLSELKAELKFEKIKWVNLSTLHLTLFFLGETNDSIVREIEEIFKTHFAITPRFTIHLKGIGIFGSKSNPKVLWVGIKHSEELQKLHQLVNERIKPLGFTPDERGFNPHITIGRIKQVDSIELLNKLVSENSNLIFQETLVDKVILYKSDLTPQGAIYSLIVIQKLDR
jgi:2'-5' RNA ligase